MQWDKRVHLAAALSILLTTTMTFLLRSSALRSTKRVCGMGPSTESTSSSTPVRRSSVISKGAEETFPTSHLQISLASPPGTTRLLYQGTNRLHVRMFDLARCGMMIQQPFKGMS